VIGQPITIDAQVSGEFTAPGDPTPPGSVTVSDGTNTCVADLSGSNGTASGSCEITEDVAGEYGFSGSYPGDSVFSSSSTSQPAEVDVGKDSSTTTLTLSTAKLEYGKEKRLKINVDVAPQFSGTPTGNVTIKSGTKTLCSITLSGGKGTCSLASSTALKVGDHLLVATYGGDATLNSSSASQELKVKQA
jgi:hypothetical protein